MLENPNDLRMPISPEYLAGRKAYRDGADYFQGNPYPNDQFRERLDWFIGWRDECDGVPVEERAEVEATAA